MVAALDLAEARTDLFLAMAVAEGGSFALPAVEGRGGRGTGEGRGGGAGLAEKLRTLKDQLGPRGIRCRHEPGRPAPAHEPHLRSRPRNHDPCGTELSRAIHYLPTDSPSPPLPSSSLLSLSSHSLDTALLVRPEGGGVSERRALPCLCRTCHPMPCHAEEEGEGEGEDQEEKLCEESVTEALDNLESRCDAVPVRQVREGSSSSTTTSRPCSVFRALGFYHHFQLPSV